MIKLSEQFVYSQFSSRFGFQKVTYVILSFTRYWLLFGGMQSKASSDGNISWMVLRLFFCGLSLLPYKKKKVVIDLVAIASFYFSQAYSTYPLWRNFKLSSYFGKRLLACSLFNKLLETTLLPQLISLLH